MDSSLNFYRWAAATLLQQASLEGSTIKGYAALSLAGFSAKKLRVSNLDPKWSSSCRVLTFRCLGLNGDRWLWHVPGGAGVAQVTRGWANVAVPSVKAEVQGQVV